MEPALWITFIAWFIGGFVHIVTGMGGGLIALPIMVLFMDAPTAILASCTLGLMVSLLLAARFRSGIDWRATAMLTVGSIPGSLLGLWGLKNMSGVWLELGMGLLLASFMLWQLAPRRLSTAFHRDGTMARLFWGCMSGLFSASTGLGGPPLAVYANLAGWDKDTARAIFGTFFSISMICVVSLDIVNGLITAPVIHATLAGAPGLLLGGLLAMPAARRIRQDTFQHCMELIVLLAAFSLIVKSILTGVFTG